MALGPALSFPALATKKSPLFRVDRLGASVGWGRRDMAHERDHVEHGGGDAAGGGDNATAVEDDAGEEHDRSRDALDHRHYKRRARTVGAERLL